MKSLKRQVLPGQLAVVATPIGNLDDLSGRARQVLMEVDVILCEDTRRTAKLIAGAGIDRPMSDLARFDAHSGPAKADAWVERLLGGASLALVSDAGTPAISDPGALLVSRARAAGVTLVAIPGPSAIVLLLSVSGFEQTAFGFRGFFPRKDAEQEREIELTAASQASQVWGWFESPERIVKTMRKFAELVPEARLAVGKELTKLHEKTFAGSAEQVAAEVEEEVESSGTRGEWCFVVLFPRPSSVSGDQDKTSESEASNSNSSDWVKALLCLREAGVSASEAVKHVSRQYGVPRNAVYASAVRIFEKKS